MKSIFIFTSNFPYGRGEEFLMNEVNALADHGFEITLIPNFIRGEKQKGIHAKIKIENDLAHSFSKTFFLMRAFLFSKTYYSFIFNNLHQVNSIDSFIYLLKFTLGYTSLLTWLAGYHNQADIYYSYWLNYRCNSLLRAKEENWISGKIISRAHGYDVYDERLEKGAFWPDRIKILENLDAVFTISESGKNYLKNKSENSTKIECIHLGSVPINNTVEFDSETVNIISCSNNARIKRLDLIEDSIKLFAQKNPQRKISWSHIGISNREYIVKDIPNNLSISFLGYIENEKIRDYYMDNKMNLFINLSDSEGIPVTIMDAFSVGIPVIARDVGGISEIVSNQNGVLLSSNGNIEEAQEALNTVLLNWSLKSKSAVKTFESNFNSITNAKIHHQKINEIINN